MRASREKNNSHLDGRPSSANNNVFDLAAARDLGGIALELETSADTVARFNLLELLAALVSQQRQDSVVINNADPFGLAVLVGLDKLFLLLWAFAFFGRSHVDIIGTIAKAVSGGDLRRGLKVPRVGQFHLLARGGVMANPRSVKEQLLARVGAIAARFFVRVFDSGFLEKNCVSQGERENDG